jgi:hypothetical protein
VGRGFVLAHDIIDDGRHHVFDVSLLEDTKGRSVSIHRTPERAHSRKPALIHPHTYKVPGRRQAGLISELPRRGLLGHLQHPDVTRPIAPARLQYIRSRTTKTSKIMTRAVSNRSISLKPTLLEGPGSRCRKSLGKKDISPALRYPSSTSVASHRKGENT